MAQNSTFRFFAQIIENRYVNDSGILSVLKMAVLFHGVSFDILFRQQPSVAMRFLSAVRTIAEEIANGLHEVGDDGEMTALIQSERQRLFSQLVFIIDQQNLQL